MPQPKTLKDWALLGGSIAGALGAIAGVGVGVVSWFDSAFVSEAEMDEAFRLAERRDMLRFWIQAARDRISKMDVDDEDLQRERDILAGLEAELASLQ
jgi:alpha-D-ribose 1-methylphosphonate 5-triphosphate diphosphatase PhnM